ncbi:MAG: AAA family ATPase [Kiloniellaceae bacterium]
MSAIYDWLQRIGLDRYAATFVEQDIDFDVLPDLTESDLIELGMSFGDRKKLQRAIAALPPFPHWGASNPQKSTFEAPQTQVIESAAERRHLTVMFCDLVGSTELSMRYEPDDLRSIVRAYQDTCAGVVARLEGYIARYMGDGVLIYFGFPRAHEDNAERAVRAALEIVEAVALLRPQMDLRLQTRVGIATGTVIVGDLVGLGAAQEFAAVGEAPNLAARLQGHAEANSVVVDSTTHRLAQSAFDFDDLGQQSLKGITLPAKAWRVLRPRELDRRAEAMKSDSLVPFVNRTGEITLMLDRWRMACNHQGQVVLLSGEAGIGKSRLLRAFVERLAGETLTAITFHCTPFHRGSALYPFVERLRRLSGLSAEDAPIVGMAKLRRLFSNSALGVDEALRLFAPLLAVKPPGQASAGGAQTDMDHLLEVLLQETEAMAQRKPLLMIVEDLHWIDPTSLEFLQRLSQRLARLRILLVLTLRPEVETEMRPRFPATGLSLNRLQRLECETIIRNLAQQKQLPQELVDTIAERTDGVALFIEQMTKAVLESDAVVEHSDRYEITAGQPAQSIPTTLRGSLLARLDRHPAAREVAQLGAVMGREFPYRMLAAVSTLPESELRSALDRLVQSELLYQAGVPPRATYRFKHGLVQEMAYTSLLRKKRRRLHGEIAAFLEDRSPHLAVTEPELLAHHYTEADLPHRAITYRLKAGERSTLRSAMVEAAAEIELGLGLLPGLRKQIDRDALELRLRVAQATALRAIKGTSAPETGAAWARAQALCGEGDNTDNEHKALHYRVLYGCFLFHQGNANLLEARSFGESLLALGQQLGDDDALLRGHSAIGRTAFGQGDFAEAHRQLEQALALNDPERPGNGSAADRPESPVIDLCYLSWTSFALGRPETALRQCRRSLQLAEDSEAAYDLVVANGNACYLHQLRQDRAAVADCAQNVINLATEKGYPHWRSLGVMFQGWVAATTGRPAEGIARFEDALAEHRATGEVLEVCYFLGVLAELLGRDGRVEAGLRRIAEALELVERTGERWYEAELHRGRGELLRLTAKADATAVEACFTRALELSRAQEARLWELRAATNLGRLYIDLGRNEEARAILESLCLAFELPELDEEVADRRAATALLQHLRAEAPSPQSGS